MKRPALLFALALTLGACSGAEVTTTNEPTVPDVPPTTVGVPDAADVDDTMGEMEPPTEVTATLDPDTVTFSRYDTGRMWTFDNPPRQFLRERYNFTPDDGWYERARLGALRFATYCSASFVSPDGLILTNHHCARQSITEVTEDGEDLGETGFVAEDMDDERLVEDLFVEQLVDVMDVTAEIDEALMGEETMAERASARQEAIAAIEERVADERGGEDAGVRVQVVEFYSGARYSAYVYRRYDDVRLAFAPEDDLGFFGGDPDNFTYPRYSLDFALFRAYDDAGEPLDTSEFYFPWSTDGTDAGDLVFVIGNPGSTTRLQTVSELAYRRDVNEPGILRLLETRADVYERFVDENPDDPMTPEIEDTFFSLSNSRKAYTGRLGGLRDEYTLARRAAAERAFRDAIEADPDLRTRYGYVLGQIDENRREAAEEPGEFGAFLGMNPGSSVASNVLGRGLFAYAVGVTGNPGLRDAALSVEEERPEALEVALIEAKLEDLVFYLGEDDQVVERVLMGRTPAEAARAIYDGTALKTQEGTEELLNEDNPSTSDDPAIMFARAVYPRYAAAQQRQGLLGAQLEELSERLARARFEVYGEDTPPDATFTLRINDGVVRGYEYNGTVAPPYTTFWGLYDHYYSYLASEDARFFELPERWLPAPDALDLETPYNFVTTNDIIGGNSGSPMLDRDLHVVGVAFDGNIESLPGDFIYLGERNRTVGVDSRGMLEAMEAVYEAERLAEELREGAMQMMGAR